MKHSWGKFQENPDLTLTVVEGFITLFWGPLCGALRGGNSETEQELCYLFHAGKLWNSAAETGIETFTSV